MATTSADGSTTAGSEDVCPGVRLSRSVFGLMGRPDGLPVAESGARAPARRQIAHRGWASAAAVLSSPVLAHPLGLFVRRGSLTVTRRLQRLSGSRRHDQL